MKSPRFEEPQIYVLKSAELLLSGRALLELSLAVLGKGVPFRFCARGWSMAPFIRDGDVITITPFQETNPGLGDIVAFTRPKESRLVVHRIVNRRGSAFYIQGDSAPDHPDGAIPVENLLGKVTRIERNRHRVWLGIGPEKILIAWLSRTKILNPLRQKLSSWLKPGFWQKLWN